MRGGLLILFFDVDAVHLKLTDEEIKYLEEAYKPVNVVGHV